jgi:hypothetical protein
VAKPQLGGLGTAALLAGGLYVAYKAFGSGGGQQPPVAGWGPEEGGAGLGRFGGLDAGGIFQAGLERGLGFDVTPAGDLIPAVGRDLTSGQIPLTPPTEPNLIQAAGREFKEAPLFTTAAVGGGAAALITGASRLFGPAKAATAGLEAGSGATATTRALGTVARTAGDVLGAATGGVSLGYSGAGIYQAAKGDTAAAGQSVQRAGEFATFGIVGFDPHKTEVSVPYAGLKISPSQVSAGSRTATITPPKSIGQAVGNLAKNLGRLPGAVGRFRF